MHEKLRFNAGVSGVCNWFDETGESDLDDDVARRCGVATTASEIDAPPSREEGVRAIARACKATSSWS